ncbi:hypothetical protein PINS_up004954 [Pythium insidiosum]|nr:hypothetical protein PINS_up004954 [Pythium insidiosum]
MHRAEKSSSKICREREVEKALELHRKKIDGVKSYLSAITRPPAPAQQPSSTVSSSSSPSKSRRSIFRRPQRGLRPSDGASVAGGRPVPPPAASRAAAPPSKSSKNATTTTMTQKTDDGSDGENDYADDDDGFEDGVVGAKTLTMEQLNSFRSVLVPVMALGCDDDDDDRHLVKDAGDVRAAAPTRLTSKPPPPPPPSGSGSGGGLQHHPHSDSQRSLHRAFRLRRQRQIQADNAVLFARLQKTTAHYRNDQLRRDWAQNVAYLSSISEFPVLETTTRGAGAASSTRTDYFGQSQSQSHDLHDEPEDEERWTPRHNALSPSSFAELPRLPLSPPAMHPIKAIPASPRRHARQLNLAPAFRSLRKGLPQQPTLPPLSLSLLSGSSSPSPSPSGASTLMSPSLARRPNALLTSPNEFRLGRAAGGDVARATRCCISRMGFTVAGASAGVVSVIVESSTDTSAPSSSCAAVGSAAAGSSALQAADNRPLRRRRLLRAHCVRGDGIANPYGFDVVARQSESGREFLLSITKETTHHLLDTISSSSLAAATAAAAGTNLSMELIARNICAHLGFAALADRGSTRRPSEMLFLVA